MVNERALATSRMFARDGTLLATAAQEGVIRWRKGADQPGGVPRHLHFVAPPIEPCDQVSEMPSEIPSPRL